MVETRLIVQIHQGATNITLVTSSHFTVHVYTRKVLAIVTWWVKSEVLLNKRFKSKATYCNVSKVGLSIQQSV